LAEFTGERVIPGKVEPDLWNEHVARYAFAARLARHKKVLDVGCGSGYGTAELAHAARHATGLDPAAEAIEEARERFHNANLIYIRGASQALPFAAGSFHLVVAFEVIEHLTDWPAMLNEARRVLAPGGQFIVSTPNKLYYEESRRKTGPNPFHEHEFEFEEFRRELRGFFPHVSLFLQNHSSGIVFHPVEGAGSAEVRVERAAAQADAANFFIAVCASAPQTGAPTYVYLPSTANVLRERELHIARLEDELAMKNEWLDAARAEHQQLVEEHRRQTTELEDRNRWADHLNRELETTGLRVAQLQDELKAEQQAAAETVSQYESKIADLEGDVAAKTQWAVATETRLSAEVAAKVAELATCVDLLHAAEATLEERTQWALRLEQECRTLEQRMGAVEASRWLKLGRAFGLGPRIGNA
jgi:SAM-dependent methyltransferase